VVPFLPEEVTRSWRRSLRTAWGAFYTVALAVGLRPSEALGLKWCDIDFAEGTLRVQRSLER
jgi:integrase